MEGVTHTREEREDDWENLSEVCGACGLYVMFAGHHKDERAQTRENEISK